MIRLMHLSVLIAVIALPAVAAKPTAEDVFSNEVDPIMGDYEGRWWEEETVVPEIAAQIYPIGRGEYHVHIMNKFDMRCPPLLDADVELKDGQLVFDNGSIKGVVKNGTIKGGRTRGNATFEMKKVERISPTMGRKPPQGAVILFEGANFDAWRGTDGWELTGEHFMMVTPDGGYLVSKEAWTDLEMHIEFRTPLMPRHRGQQRGNSGVFIQDEYEVQILDTYGLPGYYDECGALYKVAAPKVNACAPPLQWQTYDITFHGARYNDAGEVETYPRITVYHNGVLIHNEQELREITAWKEVERLRPPPSKPGHIKLQGHDNYVQFRNIWVKPL